MSVGIGIRALGGTALLAILPLLVACGGSSSTGKAEGYDQGYGAVARPITSNPTQSEAVEQCERMWLIGSDRYPANFEVGWKQGCVDWLMS